MKTIGLIGGTGWISTVEYYKQLNEKINQKLGGLNFASCILHSLNYGEIDVYNRTNNQEAIYKKLHLAAQGLILSGAEGIALCANTMHRFADVLASEMEVPIIHIAEATAKQAISLQLRKIGLVGTLPTMEEDFYKLKFINSGIDVIVPDKTDREFIHHIINNELIKSIFLTETKQKLITIFDRLKAQGAQGFVLGCTEIPLLIHQEDYPLPLLNTLDIHTDAIVEFALHPED
jgi:aspartate racemase